MARMSRGDTIASIEDGSAGTARCAENVPSRLAVASSNATAPAWIASCTRRFALHCIAFNLKKVVGHTAVLMICILIPVPSARRRDQFLILATVPRQPKTPRSTSFIDSLDTRTDTAHVSSASWPPFHSPFRHCPRNRRIRWAVAGHHCGIVRRRPGGRCNDDPNDGGGWPDAQLLRLASMYTAAEYTV